ncbi:unnamed protein product [Penicillium salamii]|nr:unnamed protein product [Penicillium salamii]
MKLIKAYFNLYHLQIESLIRKERLRRRFRKISTNKIFISDGEFKHSNDKVNITLYVYNKQKLNYLLKLKKRFIRLFNKPKFARKLRLIKKIGLKLLFKQKQKSIMLKNLLPKYNTDVNTAKNIYYTRFMKKSFRRLRFYMYYKQMLYINKTKFEYTYLHALINLIKNIFKKIKLFTQPLELKLKKDRRVLRYLKVLIRKAKIKKIKLAEKTKKFFNFNNFDSDNFIQDNTKSKNLKKILLSNIKYKRVSGVRLQAAGRLTRRFSASRSICRTKYKGNLENVYSSIKGLPTPLLRGNDKANLQYTVINSTSRVGAFGVKG